ncbi:ThuA domain-containing protein [Roseateles violae]|uniref:ThuA domain-containing protein n=1 Tax=Roseateles violae TaxID=3058042 RepID=A0ABT8DXC0_9BURK|nr:ThuA domain-containing protein [Pelomonas sp. PFR6]MDN3921329.1 ThuA domain-containing protein [Pelomonas sp. PFR6]
MRGRALLMGAAGMLIGLAAQAAGPIVLIGGAGHEGPGRHEYAAGLKQLAGWLKEALPQAEVQAFESGWPRDPVVLAQASTLVLYLDGADKHPLNDPAKRRAFAAAMQRGVGVVALHQASTAAGEDKELQQWFGALRPGLFDRTTETTTLRPAADSPLSRGLRPIVVRDEFYPTLRFAEGAMPVLSATLHPQYRAGQPLLDGAAEDVTVAWSYQRAGGGRSFGYSGAHFLTALEPLRPLLVNAIAWTAGLDLPVRADVTSFHHDAQRSGWFANEVALAPATMATGFGQLWQSPPLAAFEGQDARLYASPLYVEDLQLTAGELRGQSFAAVIAATSNGDVYAINARRNGDVAPGRVLWRTHLADPCRLQPAPLDGVPTGILSTPVVDAARGRLYVTACDSAQRWQAYTLDLGSGAVQPGWPVRLDENRLNEVNRNAGPELLPPKRKFDFRIQRGALNLSPDGERLYIAFGETETGWLAAVDTGAQPRVASAFAAVAMPHRGSGGIWGAGGPAVDADGHVYAVTGSGFDGYKEQPQDWTQSVLKLDRELNLVGTYTPFNHCITAKNDIDLGSGGVALLPGSSLLTVGGKQGNVYLLDRARLPGRLDRRPACGGPASEDGSLHDGRGPLNVFGPYSEEDAALDLARARSVPASFRTPDGALQIIASGTSKAALGSSENVAPSLARLAVKSDSRLEIAARAMELVFQNPGSPVVSSRPDGSEAIVWVLDENARRSAALSGPNAPAPVLHAVEALTMRPLWRSAPGELATSGKYNEPIVVRGQVIVGTDRIQAFGVGGKRMAAAPKSTAVAAAADDGRPVDGAAIYRQRCAACHDAPQGSIPPKSWIAARGRTRIVEALSRGAMQVQAAGLSAREIEAVAAYLQ